ncbi:hypothetical protein Ahy_A01g000109 [Arachis hypogaea]|uniref:HNH nuclease domain-containing protein n=1 Tax=Arachis hypogaea TaxID=3818 RepID=A0A445EJC4_ARAHY|nr:hypothetical protein Ahy_A01g000109 [Arachis hypogaea]
MSSSSRSDNNREEVEERRRRRSSPSKSPIRDRSKTTSSKLSSRSSTLTRSGLDDDLVADFEDLRISSDPNPNPRSFPYSVKQQCWEKAEKIKGRDPDRWRRDALGNTVFRKLVGCPGCLCHDYDHILPYSKVTLISPLLTHFMSDYRNACSIPLIITCSMYKIVDEHQENHEGGKSTLENCQVLQATVNRSKGNRTDISKSELIQKSSYCRVSGRDMDLLELSAYGNVRRGPESGGCRIQ